MKTLVYTSPASAGHKPPEGHPERPERLGAVERAIRSVDALATAEPRQATREEVARVHTRRHIESIFETGPSEGLASIDADTWMSPGSLEAALAACGAAVEGVDKVVAGEAEAVFVACRPPGHHAEPERAMGFCLFNQIAVAAAHGFAGHGMTRIALVDFDVHHGNGTQAYAEREERLFFASIHQGWIYPGTGSNADQADNIVNVAVERATGSKAWREALEEKIFSRIPDLRADLLLVSAGFDGHRDDPLAGLDLTEEDYAWAGERLGALAKEHAHARLVCTLEGGYDIDALEKSLAGFLRAIAAA